MMSNPALYNKMLLAFNRIENGRLDPNPSANGRDKRPSVSEAIITKRGVRTFKKVISSGDK